MPDTLVPVGERFKSEACDGCGHRAEGIVTKHNSSTEVVAWENPPADCPCVCHAAWHMVNRTKSSDTSLSQGVA